MRTKRIIHLLVLLAALMLVLLACRREEATPQASTPETAATTEPNEPQDETAASPTETAAPEEEPEATATGEPSELDFTQAIDPADIDWPPQVVATEPASGPGVGVDSEITLRFDQPMDQTSVESAWSIEPAVDGRFDWPRPDTLVFLPQESLARGTSYRVSLNDTAEAQNGLALEEAVTFDLQTVGFLEVTQLIPEDGTQEVQTDSAITVVFNKPVVPLVSGDQQSTLPQPLTVEPAVAGAGQWLSTSIYRFAPEGGFAGATTYTVTVDPNLEDVTGSTLGEPVTWQFTTVPPSVVSVQPSNGAALVIPTRPISITFNMPMDTAVTEAAVSLSSADAPTPPLETTWEEDGRTLVLTPQEPLGLGAEYEVLIGQSASAANGNATLDRETTSRFSTVPLPAVRSTQPEEGAVTDYWQRGIFIQFASPMDPDTLEDRVRIEPQPERVNYYYNEYIDELNPENSNFGLSLDFNLEPNSAYSVTIPADAADPYGNTLGEDYVLRFTTPGAPPVASFNLPQTFSQLSTSFPTAVEVIHRDISEFTVTLNDLGLPIQLFADNYVQSDAPPRGEEVGSWTIPVSTAAGEVGVTAVPLAGDGVLPTGVYFVTVTAPGMDPEMQYWQNQRNVLIVADTNLVIKEMPDEVHVWATDLASGEPVSGRNLTLYGRNGRELGTATTDGSGFAAFAYQPLDDYLQGVVVVSNEPGAEGFGVGSSVWSGGFNPWREGLNYAYNLERPLFAYIYTDRPIYRPGDTVYFKGILREADYGRYALPTEEQVTVVFSTNFFTEEQGLREDVRVDVSEDGIFSGEFQLPEDVSLGSYSIGVLNEDIEGSRSFSVAEYRRPEFQVTLTPEQAEALRGEPVDVTLQAEYFFGGSPADLEVNYTIYQDLYTPDVPGPNYSFSDRGDFFYTDPGLFGPPVGGTYGQSVTSGSGRTDENGRLVIELPADLLAEVEEGSRVVTVEAFVNDIANFPIVARTEVVFHGAEVYVGIRPSEYAPAAGTETSVELLTVDWDGEPAPEQNVEVVFYEREWERSRNSDFGVYFTEWEPIDTEVARTTVTTDERGEAVAGFTPENGGSYVAVATVTDGGGRTHTSSTAIWAIDADFAAWRTDPRERTMDLVVDQTDYNVGDTAQILVQSPFAGPTQAWLTIERGNLIEQRVITLNGGSEVLDLPMTAAYAPNVFVTVTAVKPVTPDDEANPFADIRVGIVELRVDPGQFNLNVELTPRETVFEPGDTAVYDIRVTDSNGNPVQADLSLALVDLAVLTLKEDNAPPILEAFYSPQPLRSQTGSGLFVSGEGLEPEVPLQGGGFGGGGGDGMAEAALARLDEEDDVRRDFPDTAFWEASIQTDAAGTATVEIPLPDTLTTWRLGSKAVTTDTLVGQSSVDVQVTLPLLVRPVTPRFFTVGDVVELGAIINNNTNEAIDTTVSLEAEGVTLNGDATQTVSVPANGRSLARWEVTVDDVEFADLTFRAEGGGYSDATKPSFGVGPDNQIPVYRYDAQDFVGTAGELDEAGRRVEAVVLPPYVDTRRGSVDLQLSPSLAAAIIEALDVLQQEEYDPACAPAVIDRLFPNVATARAIDELGLDSETMAAQLSELIPQDVNRLESLIRSDGGWAWCFSTESDPWFSAYAVLALAKAQQAGYDVNGDILARGVGYVERQLEDAADLGNAWEVNRQAFFLYAMAEAGTAVADEADVLFEEHRGLLDPYAKALLVLAYELSNAQGDNQQTLLADLNDDAVISATGAHWEDDTQDVANLSSTVRGTAMVIDALSRVQPDSPLLPPAVRWLMVARNATVWPTWHETAWSIYGLTSWMAASDELSADYTYQVDINGVGLTEGSFNEENVTESQNLSVPVRSLLETDPNYFNFQRGEGDGRLYYTLHLNSFVPADAVEPADRGFNIERTYYDAECDSEVETCEPLESVAAGQRVRVELTVIVPNDRVFVVVEDPLPAGAEGIDPNLETTSADLGGQIEREGPDFPFPFGYWGWWSFNRIEFRDEKVVFYADYLPAGTYQYTYFLQTNIPGEFQVMPAVAYESYFPEVFGRSAGQLFTITAEEQ